MSAYKISAYIKQDKDFICQNWLTSLTTSLDVAIKLQQFLEYNYGYIANIENYIPKQRTKKNV